MFRGDESVDPAPLATSPAPRETASSRSNSWRKGSWSLGGEHDTDDSGLRNQGFLGFREGLGFRVQGFGFWVGS